MKMTLLDKYLFRTTLIYLLIACVLVIGIESIFALVRELKYVGTGDYDSFKAIEYVGLTLPRKLYNLFPMAGLLGALMGLSVLAGNSELIVMRASGYSVKRLMGVVLTCAFLLTCVVSAIGEWVMPVAEHQANVLRALARGNGQAILTAQGIWLKEGHSFVYVQSVGPKGALKGVTRYTYDAQSHLVETSFAERAVFTAHHWQLENVHRTHIDSTRRMTTSDIVPQMSWTSHIDNDLLKVLVRDPADLSLRELYAYIDYLHDNSLESQTYWFAFWKKICQPIACLVMVFLAIPFVLGPLRESSMGAKMMTGIIIGFVFYIVNSLFGPISIVYHLPPLVAALLPSLLFSLVGFFAFQ